MIWYHGTDKNGYAKIKENGLAIGSYITPCLQTALTTGGEYVFYFDYPEQDTNKWQLRTSEIITDFIAVCKHSIECIDYDKNQWLKLQDNNRGGKRCENCNGRGEVYFESDNRPPHYHLLIGGSRFSRNPYPKPRFNICEKCNGTGIDQILSRIP